MSTLDTESSSRTIMIMLLQDLWRLGICGAASILVELLSLRQKMIVGAILNSLLGRSDDWYADVVRLRNEIEDCDYRYHTFCEICRLRGVIGWHSSSKLLIQKLISLRVLCLTQI